MRKMIKTCRICKECKDVKDFYNRKKEKDGLASECKLCKRQIDREYREKNAESIAIKKKIYRQNNKEKIKEGQKQSVAKNKEHYIHYLTKYKQEHREELLQKASDYYWSNRESILEKQKVIRDISPLRHILSKAKTRAKRSGTHFDLTMDDLFVPQICPILGIPISTGNLTREKQSPSIDRMDNSKGYTKGNSWIISSLSNTMKSDASPEELFLFARWVVGESVFIIEKQDVERKVLNRWHSGIKSRSKRDGIIFDILPDDLYIPKICPVFGRQLSKNLPCGSKMLPSVDKIIPELGYIRGNIQIISKQANMMKNKASKLELFAFSGWVFKNFAKNYLTPGSEKARLIHTLLQEQKFEEAQHLLQETT